MTALNERVELQERLLTKAESGEQVEEYVTRHTRWAAVVAVSGREYIAAAQAQATITHHVELRNDLRLDPNWRVLWRGRVLNIVAVLSDQRRPRQTLLCVEPVGGAP